MKLGLFRSPTPVLEHVLTDLGCPWILLCADSSGAENVCDGVLAQHPEELPRAYAWQPSRDGARGTTVPPAVASLPAQYESLEGRVAVPRWRRVTTQGEAMAAAAALPPPVAVAGCGRGGRFERIADSPEDAALAFSVVTKRCPDQPLVAESAYRGRAFSVFGVVDGDGYHVHGHAQHTLARRPLRFPAATAVGPDVADPAGGWAHQCAAGLGLEAAALRVDAIVTDDGPLPYFIDAVGLPLGTPEDLVALAGNPAFGRSAVRLALGQGVEPAIPIQSGAALAWLPPHTGRVTALPETDAVAAMPGVVTVQVTAQPGQDLAHAVDIEGRERVGYVAAQGATAAEALQRAQSAAAACDVPTETVLG